MPREAAKGLPTSELRSKCSDEEVERVAALLLERSDDRKDALDEATAVVAVGAEAALAAAVRPARRRQDAPRDQARSLPAVPPIKSVSQGALEADLVQHPAGAPQPRDPSPH